MNNIRKHFNGVNKNTFIISAGFIGLIVFASFAFQAQMEVVSSSLLSYITTNYGNYFINLVNIFVVALIIIAFSKKGKIKLGGEDAKPEFKYGSWVAMLFAAGMGIGLVFWGVVEPMEHYLNSGHMYTNSGAVDSAIATSMFSWGIHAWAIYAVIAIILGYYSYNLGLPLAPRSFFYPLLKDRIYGFIGDMIDGLSIIVIVIGLATSLGLGAKQINAGLAYIFNLPFTAMMQVILIVGITTIAMFSVISGIGKGVKILSDINLRLAIVFMIVLFIMGPSLMILSHLITSTIDYFVYLPSESIKLLSAADTAWKASWPVFYMAWWISFAPSVGIFIAKISRGRSIRQIIFTVLIMPTIITILWIDVFGGIGISTLVNNLGEASNLIADPSTTFFQCLDLALSSSVIKYLFALVYITLMIIFFVTSADSGAIIVDNIAKQNDRETTKTVKIMWTFAPALIAVAMMFVGGENALDSLQSLVISTGFVFGMVILIALVLYVYNFLREE